MANGTSAIKRSLPHELVNIETGTKVRLQVIVVQTIAGFSIQRGGSVLLTAQ